ncbi:elongation factor G [Engelhardtia mirabilis]|uniref:Elongation factor G n=1 Tax=Engelhardtia mirabilis TaxID=2528011 RepID=A0A518BP72_9BACT|nr:Elongation factor G [Planctomycetes bacterium Pla133]QDV03107.1 Elongation factor G [Planctomycetes bacterium Pla86]
MSHAPSEIRNVAFVGHPGGGKTTLVDALALKTGATDRRGSVADKTSICDTEPEEQDKQHTLQMAIVESDWGGRDWNWIDTPGYPDFEAEVRAGMFAADLVVGVVSASGGVTHNLRRKFAAAEELGRPRALLVTHLDADNVDFDTLVMELREAFGEICVPVLLPEFDGAKWVGAHRTMKDPQSDWRKRLMDRVMDGCDDVEAVEHYLETEELTEEELIKHYPSALAAHALVPIMVCNPVKDVGLDEVLDFLNRAAPSPLQHGSLTAGGEPVHNDPSEALMGVVFAVRSDPHVGKVCMARILSGKLAASAQVQGVGEGTKPEKLGGLFRLLGGKHREPIDEAQAGGLCAFTKVEGLKVGQTFGAPGADTIAADFVAMPEPMVSMAVRPKSRADEQKIGTSLHRLEAEDPTFKVSHDPLTHELVVTGMSDLHLQLMESRLKRRFGVEIETSIPRIAYRETVRKPAEGHHRHKKQSGGRGQFGECHLRLRPAPEGAGLTFIDKVVGGAIPKNLIPAIEKGIREIAEEGILTHSKVVDVEVEVYDGKFHAVDSDEASFKMAGKRAFRDAFERASPALLEPVVVVEVHVPSDHAGTIFSDLTSHRRAHVLEQNAEADGAVTVIKAHAPLSTMQSYHRDLKSQTAGAGTWSMRLDHYAAMPAPEQQKVVQEFAKVHDDE